MPPNGLYPVPRNHLYSASSSAVRPKFNTMSFAELNSELEAEIAQQVIEESARVVNDFVLEKTKKRKKKHSSGVSGEDDALMVATSSAETNGVKASPVPASEEKKDTKKKKKRSLGTAVQVEVTNKAGTPEALVKEATLTVEGNDERKSKKKGNKQSSSSPIEDDEVAAGTSDFEATPTTTCVEEQDSKSKVVATYQDVDDAMRSARKSAKKRKRVSFVQTDASSADEVGKSNDDVFLGGDWLEQLESSTSNAGTTFEALQEDNVQTEPPAKKKRKTKRKSEDANPAKPQAKSISVSDNPREAISKQIPRESVSKKKDAEEKVLQHSEASSSSARSDRPGQKNVSQAGFPFVKEPRNTPIPLPPNSSQAADSDIASLQQRISKAGRGTSDVLVTETPPKKIVVSTLRKIVGASTTRPKPKEIPLIEVSSATVFDASHPPASAPAALPNIKKAIGQPSSQASLTASNLERYSQPLSDEAKPRPRSARSVSVSSASSMSIKDAFTRQHKQKLSPICIPDNNSNPFFTPSSQKKTHPTPHQKSDGPTFDAAYRTLLTNINMVDEQAYLAQHLELRASNDAAGPLPCLKSATGCNSKLEQQLSASKEYTTKQAKGTANRDENQLSFDVSVAATFEAEKFLHNAVVARVPVPAGNLEGTYTLYCPKYIETHIDKYGWGLREITVSKPSGFNGNTYTARLSIPPRPMAYNVLSFHPPPNASFCATKLITSAEGYTMDLVTLGHGYILLRVDIGLFLTGKATVMGTNVGREICMEFVGVKDDAVKWQGLNDNVKTAREKDAQRLKKIAEREEQQKKEKKEAWEKRKEDMKKAKEVTDASPVKGGKLELGPKTTSKAKQSLKKVSKAGMTKSAAIDVDKEMTKEEEEDLAWEKRKKKSAQEKMTLDKDKHKARAKIGVAASSSPVKKEKATTQVGVSSSPIKKASQTTRVGPTKTAAATTDAAVSPSPRKRGRPSNVELSRRNKELEAMLRAKA